MVFHRITSLRALPSTTLARQTSRALRPATLPTRSFSLSRVTWLDGNQNKSSSHEFPTFTKASTTRKISAVKQGTDFNFHKLPAHLIPRGWTNEPQDLEACLDLDLHEDFASFPRDISPVLSYKEQGSRGWWAHLLCEGSDTFDQDFYLALSDYQVYRLDTKIELMPLLACMKGLADNMVGEKEGESVGHKMPYALKSLLEHPELEWYELGQDEVIEVCTQATS